MINPFRRSKPLTIDGQQILDASYRHLAADWIVKTSSSLSHMTLSERQTIPVSPTSGRYVSQYPRGRDKQRAFVGSIETELTRLGQTGGIVGLTRLPQLSLNKLVVKAERLRDQTREDVAQAFQQANMPFSSLDQHIEDELEFELGVRSYGAPSMNSSAIEAVMALPVPSQGLGIVAAR